MRLQHPTTICSFLATFVSLPPYRIHLLPFLIITMLSLVHIFLHRRISSVRFRRARGNVGQAVSLAWTWAPDISLGLLEMLALYHKLGVIRTLGMHLHVHSRLLLLLLMHLSRAHRHVTSNRFSLLRRRIVWITYLFHKLWHLVEELERLHVELGIGFCLLLVRLGRTRMINHMGFLLPARRLVTRVVVPAGWYDFRRDRGGHGY
mmetsp:Transcript_33633/g.54133  ORF Transcript_33633/g.54133 Transcript_33633/m.54133 type:complete len:205 (+) Transcript_33633:228-842(+)